MPLSDLQIKGLRPSDKPRKISDGGGLHLLVSPTGSKLWRLACRYGGKQKLLSFGGYPAVPLADARARRDEAKALLKRNIDPSEKSKLDRITATASGMPVLFRTGVTPEPWPVRGFQSAMQFFHPLIA